MPRAMDGAIVWERLERRELKRRERLMGGGARPGQRPVPSQPAGTDLLPQIEHIVVLMMENHSYDNYFGMLRGRGEGFPIGPGGEPGVTNPGTDGEHVRRPPVYHGPAPAGALAELACESPAVETRELPGVRRQYPDGTARGRCR